MKRVYFYRENAGLAWDKIDEEQAEDILFMNGAFIVEIRSYGFIFTAFGANPKLQILARLA